jgi:hypothetical protein
LYAGAVGGRSRHFGLAQLVVRTAVNGEDLRSNRRPGARPTDGALTSATWLSADRRFVMGLPSFVVRSERFDSASRLYPLQAEQKK